MSVTQVSVGVAYTATGLITSQTLTQALTLGSVARMTVYVVLDGSIDTTPTVKFNNLTLTECATARHLSNNRYVGHWYTGDSPIATTANLVIGFQNGNSGDILAVVRLLNGVDPSTPVGGQEDSGLLSAGSPFVSGSITGTADGLIISGFLHLDTNAITAGGGQSDVVTAVGSVGRLSSSTKVAAGSTTFTYTTTGSGFGFHVAANFLAAAGGGGGGGGTLAASVIVV